MKKLVSVVVPMYYEEEVAEKCYEELTKVMQTVPYEYDLLFINDGSLDRTREILKGIAEKDKRAKVINFARNFGHQAAVTAGIKEALGDAIVIIDADLQDPPALIADMLKVWEDGGEVVYAVRKKRKGETWFKLLTAKIFYRFLNRMTDVDIPKDTGDFRLIDRKVADVFNQMPEKNRFIRGMVSWVGFNQVPIEYERQERFAGETKYPFKKMIKFAADAIFSFSSKPLKTIQFLGFLSMGISVAMFLYAIIVRIFGLDFIVPGWASLMVVTTFIGGVQLLSLGIIGEYIARIYEESKDRPLYIVQERLNMDDEQ